MLSTANAADKIPDDVRYMLEDMYGADKSKWPASRFIKDLNNDGFDDWVAQNKKCQSTAGCPAELFLCVPDKQGKCSEYCYININKLNSLQLDLKKIKCESTC